MRITLIFKDEHLLDWSNYIIL